MKIMNNQLPFIANLKAIIILILFSTLAFSCKNNEKDKPPTEQEIRIAKEKEEELVFNKFVIEIQTKHNAILLDSLFIRDCSELTYSYITERNIVNTEKPIFATAIIFDITKLTDTTYVLMSLIRYQKQTHEGFFYAELKCSVQLINKLGIGLNVNNSESRYVFLLARFNTYSPIDFQHKDYTEYLLSRSAKGVCLDIVFNPDIDRFLYD